MKIITLVIFLYFWASLVFCEQYPPDRWFIRATGQKDFCAIVRIESQNISLFKLNWQGQDASCLGHYLPRDLCKQKNDQAYQAGLNCY